MTIFYTYNNITFFIIYYMNCVKIFIISKMNYLNHFNFLYMIKWYLLRISLLAWMREEIFTHEFSPYLPTKSIKYLNLLHSTKNLLKCLDWIIGNQYQKLWETIEIHQHLMTLNYWIYDYCCYFHLNQNLKDRLNFEWPNFYFLMKNLSNYFFLNIHQVIIVFFF